MSSQKSSINKKPKDVKKSQQNMLKAALYRSAFSWQHVFNSQKAQRISRPSSKGTPPSFDNPDEALNTQALASLVITTLKRLGVSKMDFGAKVLKLKVSEHALSVYFEQPLPWNKLSPDQKEKFHRMAHWACLRWEQKAMIKKMMAQEYCKLIGIEKNEPKNLATFEIVMIRKVARPMKKLQF